MSSLRENTYLKSVLKAECHMTDYMSAQQAFLCHHSGVIHLSLPILLIYSSLFHCHYTSNNELDLEMKALHALLYTSQLHSFMIVLKLVGLFSWIKMCYIMTNI